MRRRRQRCARSGASRRNAVLRVRGRSVLRRRRRGAIGRRAGRTGGGGGMTRLISIVGQSGVGKTTFIEKLVPELKRRGLRVAVVKHHAHPTPLDTVGKDSWRFAQAGADAVMVSSPVEVARFERTASELTLAEIAARFDGFDLILTEGFKREAAPKIEFSRAAVSTTLLCREQDLLAVVCDYAAPTGAPRFALDDAAGVADLIEQFRR